MTTQDIIDQAYMTLHEKGIHRGNYAVDALGNPCPNSEGVKFCSAGAIWHASETGGADRTTTQEAFSRVQNYINEHMPSDLGTVSITAWNDFHATDEQVLDTFRQLATPTVVCPEEIALTV